MGGIEGAVTGMSGGNDYFLVTTAERRVLTFGFGALGPTAEKLGLGDGVGEALTPTAIDGITMGEGGGGPVAPVAPVVGNGGGAGGFAGNGGGASAE